MAGIIWLASYPKSGNTWLRAFLHNLLRDPAKPMAINQLTQFTHGDTLRHWYDRAAGESIDGWSQDRIAQLRPRVHQLLSESWPDSVFVKTHNALAQQDGVPLIPMEYTTAAIYVVRDPRDVAVSMTHHFGLTLDEAVTMLANETAATAMTDLSCSSLACRRTASAWTRRSASPPSRCCRDRNGVRDSARSRFMPMPSSGPARSASGAGS